MLSNLPPGVTDADIEAQANGEECDTCDDSGECRSCYGWGEDDDGDECDACEGSGNCAACGA